MAFIAVLCAFYARITKIEMPKRQSLVSQKKCNKNEKKKTTKRQKKCEEKKCYIRP